MRTDDVQEWLRQPLTMQYLGLLQAEVRGTKNLALAAIEQGNLGAAASAKGAVNALRWALTDAIVTLTDEAETKEDISGGEDRDKDPEDIHPARFADALSKDDGDEEVERAAHGRENGKEGTVLRDPRGRSRLRP